MDFHGFIETDVTGEYLPSVEIHSYILQSINIFLYINSTLNLTARLCQDLIYAYYSEN